MPVRFRELVAHRSFGDCRLLFLRVVGTHGLDVGFFDHLLLQVLHLLVQNALFAFLSALRFLCHARPVAEIAVVDSAFFPVDDFLLHNE